MISKIKDWWYVRQRKKELAKAPTSLDAAVDFLMEKWSPEAKQRFMQEPEEAPGGQYHHFSGMAMRNGWGLWVKEQPLTQWFRSHGIWHADDMSAIIYEAVWFRLHEKKFDITKEAKYYKKYWKMQGFNFDGEPIKGFKEPSSFTVKVTRKNKKRG